MARDRSNYAPISRHFISDLGNYFLKRGVQIIFMRINTQFFIWHDTCLNILSCVINLIGLFFMDKLS